MNNSISFGGKIYLTDYTGHGKLDKVFYTSMQQDELVKAVAKKIAPLETLKVLSKEQADSFHKVIENVTGTKIPNIDNEKGFYRSESSLSYGDRNIRPWSGIHLNMYF